jgi:hypothetical protein
MKRIIFAAALCVALTPALTGCASLQKVPEVVNDVASEILRDVQEAQQIIEVLHSLTTSYFLLHSDPAMQANVEQGFAVVDLALNAAIRASIGAKSASDNEYDLAFANFRAAWLDLASLLKSLGIMTADSGKPGAMKSTRGHLDVPEPRAAHNRVKF